MSREDFESTVNQIYELRVYCTAETESPYSNPAQIMNMLDQSERGLSRANAELCQLFDELIAYKDPDVRGRLLPVSDEIATRVSDPANIPGIRDMPRKVRSEIIHDFLPNALWRIAICAMVSVPVLFAIGVLDLPLGFFIPAAAYIVAVSLFLLLDTIDRFLSKLLVLFGAFVFAVLLLGAFSMLWNVVVVVRVVFTLAINGADIGRLSESLLHTVFLFVAFLLPLVCSVANVFLQIKRTKEEPYKIVDAWEDVLNERASSKGASARSEQGGVSAAWSDKEIAQHNLGIYEQMKPLYVRKDNVHGERHEVLAQWEVPWFPRGQELDEYIYTGISGRAVYARKRCSYLETPALNGEKLAEMYSCLNAEFGERFRRFNPQDPATQQVLLRKLGDGDVTPVRMARAIVDYVTDLNADSWYRKAFRRCIGVHACGENHRVLEYGTHMVQFWYNVEVEPEGWLPRVMSVEIRVVFDEWPSWYRQSSSVDPIQDWEEYPLPEQPFPDDSIWNMVAPDPTNPHGVSLYRLGMRGRWDFADAAYPLVKEGIEAAKAIMES